MPSGIACAALANRSIVWARSRWYAIRVRGRRCSAENAMRQPPWPSGTAAPSGAEAQRASLSRCQR